MSKKILKVVLPEKCIGCELCVLACQRLVGKAGLNSSPIKILRQDNQFNIHLDPEVNNLDIKKIADICPRGCYSVVEVNSEEGPEFSLKENELEEY